jgi:hypothetical protein
VIGKTRHGSATDGEQMRKAGIWLIAIGGLVVAAGLVALVLPGPGLAIALIGLPLVAAGVVLYRAEQPIAGPGTDGPADEPGRDVRRPD